MSLLRRIEESQRKNHNHGNEIGDGTTRPLNIHARRVAPPGVQSQRDTYLDLKIRVQNRLLAELDPSMDLSRGGDVRNTIQSLFALVLTEESIALSRPET